MKKFLFITLLVGIVFLAPHTIATDLQNAENQVEESHEQLLDVKDDTALSPEEKLQKEIDARVSIVKNALALSLQEIGNLRDSLNKLPEFKVETREIALKQGFTDDLKKFEDYYIVKQNEVAKTTFTLDTIKDFAKMIIDYRDTIYNPKTAEIVDFTLLFYNEDAIATAKTRLLKIADNIKKLEGLKIIAVGRFKTGLDKVAELLTASDALDIEARAIILFGAPVIPSAESADTTVVVPVPPTERELLIRSLGNVKSAYEIFVQIGKDIKIILGIR